jgi:hypothetical protein
VTDPANAALDFDMDAANTAKQIREWHQERSREWREQARAAERKAFLASVNSSQPTPGPVDKRVPEMDAEVTEDDKESEQGGPAANDSLEKRLNEVESESDEVAEVQPDESPKTETKQVWDAKNPRRRLQAEVLVPRPPFPLVPMSASKKRVRPLFCSFRFSSDLFLAVAP